MHSKNKRTGKGLNLEHRDETPMLDFELVPNSKKLQKISELWLLKDFKLQIAFKTVWKKLKLSFWAISPFAALFS